MAASPVLILSSPPLVDISPYSHACSSRRPRKAPTLRTGSNAAPVPDDVLGGFCTARTILKSSKAPGAEEIVAVHTGVEELVATKEASIPRRTEWAARAPNLAIDSSTTSEMTEGAVVDQDSSEQAAFKDLKGSYGFNAQRVTVARESVGEPLAKRACIEPVIARRPETNKPRVKKGPVTITDRAIVHAQGLPAEVEPLDISDKARGFIANQPATPTEPAETKPKKRSRKKVEAKCKVKPQLLAPEVAHERFSKQNVIFGTSSQLTNEPTSYLRDLQQAIRESEAIAANELDEAEEQPETVRKLWSISARGFDDTFLEPDPLPTRSKAEFGQFVDIDCVSSPRSPTVSTKVPVLKLDKRPRTAPLLLSGPPSITHQQRMAQSTKTAATDIASANATAKDPPKRKRGRPRNTSPSIPHTTTPSPRATALPKEKKTKATKPRTSKPRATNPKAPRKPKKAARARPTAGTVEDISVAAPPQPPQPAQHSHKLVREPVAPADIAAQKALFAAISGAIRTQPRGRSLAAPTWHEKILLYDPIILEDLTEELNAGMLDEFRRTVEGQGVAGDDDVASILAGLFPLDPRVVRRWCEENSICCLWKESLHGGVRKRY